MPVFQLGRRISFPSATRSGPDGLLAVGGDLSVERLLLAYANGIFPWYSEGQPILWWSPDPRMLLFLDEFRCSKSLRKLLKKKHFRVTLDTAFEEVVNACSKAPRQGQDGTWITAEMKQAYCALHEEGYAHSVECWHEDTLAGGLYGVSLGRCFFGESMFSAMPNASKVALAILVQTLKKWDFDFVDCQMETDHLRSLGAREAPRSQFLSLLKEGQRFETRKGLWTVHE